MYFISDTPELNITIIHDIFKLHSGLDFSVESLSTQIMLTAINSIIFQLIIPTEQAVSKFTNHKLKIHPSTWKSWEAAGKKIVKSVLWSRNIWTTNP